MTGSRDPLADGAALDRALEFLYSLRTFGVKPGVGRTRTLLDTLGMPDRRAVYLHIAGTNGKGSTAAMLASILEAAGLRVGLFTSPHLVRFTERVRVNGQEISPQDVLRILERIRCYFNPDADHPTFFEIITAMAATYFAEQRCDVVVWEAGMGGMHDATNAVKSAASIITSVSLDHCQWLGSTIEEIALEKAGIIHADAPVFVQDQDVRVVNIIAERVASVSTCVEVVEWPDTTLSDVQTLPGPYQPRNAALAAAVARWYLTTRKLDQKHIDKCIAAGLSSVKWPGRFQTLFSDPLTIVDCAHNPGAFDVLRDSLTAIEPTAMWYVVIGAMADKDVPSMLTRIKSVCSEFWYVKPQNDRAMEYDTFYRHANAVCPGVDVVNVPNAASAVEMIRACAGSGNRFIIAGSCYLAGDVIGVLSGTGRDDRGTDPLRQVS